MTEVIMPKMGDGMEEGTLVEWLVPEGTKVKSGQVIGTIQTDKATLELEAPGSGFLSGLLIKGGETVPVGKPIGVILKEGESVPSGWGSASVPAKASEAVQATTNGSLSQPSASSQDSSEGRIKASPLAKKVASDLGINLSLLQGTGPGGRIIERDVRGATPAPMAVQVISPVVSQSGEANVVKLNRLRQITAQRTQQSKQQVPHFYVTVDVDVEKILGLRRQFEEDGAGKVTINDFVIKACVRALQDMPEVNAVFQGETVTTYGAVHIGMAVAISDGLTVPVLKNAQDLSLRAISAKARELASKAKDNKLHPDELSGSTFSISNMGMLNVDNFIAIINQPNSAIVAVSTASKKVVVNADDEIEVRTRMNVSGSFDHRAVDGAIGAKFMNAVRDYLENPTRLLE